MEMKGIHFIEDWKAAFKIFNTDTSQFDKILNKTTDGVLFHGTVNKNETLIKFDEMTDEYVQDEMWVKW